MSRITESIRKKIDHITFDLKLKWALLMDETTPSRHNELRSAYDNYRMTTDSNFNQALHSPDFLKTKAEEASRNSGWNITQGAMEFVNPNSMTNSNYEAKDKILIVEEPHHDTKAHFNLFLFLE